MRAVVYERYGPAEVLQLRDLPDPTPGPGELVVKVHAAALNPKDSFVRKGRFRWVTGNRFPRRLGYDWAGEVLADPAGVYRPGDRVWGHEDGFSADRGTLAERFTPRHDSSGRLPEGLSFTDGAAIPLAAQTALQALRDRAQVRPGDRVCVHGASGGVGVHAIQIAKALGATVTSVSSARNQDFCRSLGADETLAYDAGDPFDGARRWRVIFDAFGNQRLATVRRCLEPKGVYVSTVPSARIVLDVLRTALTYPKAKLVAVRSRTADLDQLATWVGEGKLRAVVDRVYPLDQIVEATRQLETKRTRGKIVLTTDPQPPTAANPSGAASSAAR